MSPAEHAARTPEKPAAILGKERLSYAELEARSRAGARLLRAHVAEGGVVALLLRNAPDFFVAAWAAQRAGLYFVPIGPKLTPSEIAYVLNDSGAGALVIGAGLSDVAGQALALLAAVARPIAFSCGGPSSFRDFDEAARARAGDPLEEREGADMLYTSGTTGRPKGVKRPLSGAPFGSDASRVARSRELFAMDADSVFLSPAPLYHAAPLRFAMSVHRLGGTVVLMDGFDAARALELIGEQRVTHSQWAPTMFSRMLALPEATRAALRAPAHRVAIHAGAPCPEPVKRAMIAWWGPILHEYYSGTESIGFTHITSEEWLRKPGSVGRPHGCAIHIVDEAGAPMPPGEIGCVYFEGRAKLAYHNDPEKTAAATHPEGWATMGDIGFLDADGYLFLTDRNAFTIITGGVNVYPREVEEALAADPRVRDCAVFGVPDADLGEAVHAAIELAPGVGADAETARAIGTALRERLSGVKAPRRVTFVAAIPRSDAGKALKRELRADLLARGDLGFPTKPERIDA